MSEAPPYRMRCIVVTPERTVLDEVVGFVALPLEDGEIGFLPGHAPLIGRMGYGELRLREDSTTRRYYVDGGFVQVKDDVVAVLTARAIPGEAIDPDVAAEHLRAARARKATTVEEMAAKERAQQQARAQLRLAGAGQPYSLMVPET